MVFKSIVAALILFLALVLVPLKLDSSLGRLLIWRVSYDMWSDSPVTGLGLGQFAVQYNNYQATYFQNSTREPSYASFADNTYFAFNEVIQIAVELGLAGFILFLMLLVCSFRIRPVADRNGLINAAKVTLIVILTFGLFSYPFSSLSISIIFVASLALLSRYTQNQKKIPCSSGAFKIVIGLPLILMLGTTYKLVEKYRAIEKWKEGYIALSCENTEAAWSNYREAYPFLENYGEFLFNYGAELSEAGFYKQSIPILTKAKTKFNHIDLYIFLGKNYEALSLYDSAETSYFHASTMIPGRVFPKYLLVRLYMKQEKLAKALALAKEIVKMDIKIQSPVTASIKSEMKTLVERQQKKTDGTSQ